MRIRFRSSYTLRSLSLTFQAALRFKLHFDAMSRECGSGGSRDDGFSWILRPCLFLQWPYPITTKSILVLDFFVSPCAFHRAIDGLKGETGIKVKRGRRKKVRPWEGNCLDHVPRKSRKSWYLDRIYSDGQYLKVWNISRRNTFISIFSNISSFIKINC